MMTDDKSDESDNDWEDSEKIMEIMNIPEPVSKDSNVLIK
jgi:hypothetical protein